jgi:hypothetical protein
MMRPLTVINGIVLGSCLSITVSLLAVVAVYVILGREYPRVQDEFGPLLTSTFIFFLMTAFSAASFYAMLKNYKSRFIWQTSMWAGLAATTWYYLP